MCSKYATITIHHSTTDSQTRPAHLKDPQSLGPALVRKQPTRPWSLPGPCGIQKTNMGHQPAGGSSSWCPELEIPNHAPIDLVVRRELGRSVRRRCPGPGGATWPSVRQSLYWHPLSIYIETPTKGRWGCSRMTFSPGATGLAPPRVGPPSSNVPPHAAIAAWRPPQLRRPSRWPPTRAHRCTGGATCWLFTRPPPPLSRWPKNLRCPHAPVSP